MKISYLKKTQFYIILISIIVLGNGFWVHYTSQELIQNIQFQKLSQSYRLQLTELESEMWERSSLYKKYMVDSHSKVIRNDIQQSEYKVNHLLYNLQKASVHLAWEVPLQKLAEINIKFLQQVKDMFYALEAGKDKKIVSNSIVIVATPLTSELLAQCQALTLKIDEMDSLLKSFIGQLRQIAEKSSSSYENKTLIQRHILLFINLLVSTLIISLLILIYFWINYRLRTSINALIDSFRNYNIYGGSIMVDKVDRSTELGQLSFVAQSFQQEAMESISKKLQENCPNLLKESESVIKISENFRKIVHEIIALYDQSELKISGITIDNEKTCHSLRGVIKQIETLIQETDQLGARKIKIKPFVNKMETLIEQIHTSIIAEQNIMKKMSIFNRIEKHQTKIFSLLVDLSLKMEHLSEQLNTELIKLIHRESDTI